LASSFPAPARNLIAIPCSKADDHTKRSEPPRGGRRHDPWRMASTNIPYECQSFRCESGFARVLITGSAARPGSDAEFAAQGWRVAAGFPRRPAAMETEWVWPLRLGCDQGGSSRAGVGGSSPRGTGSMPDNTPPSARPVPLQLSEREWDNVLAVTLRARFVVREPVVGLPCIKFRPGHIVNIPVLASFGAFDQAVTPPPKAA